MLKVRTGAFETNSSSMHSIAIKCNKKGISPEQYAHMISRWYEDDELIHVRFDDFGWGPYAYIDFETKLSYLVTLIKEVNGISLPGHWGASDKTFDDVKKKTVDQFLCLSDDLCPAGDIQHTQSYPFAFPPVTYFVFCDRYILFFRFKLYKI